MLPQSPLHGPRLCSAPPNGRCAASGARRRNPSSHSNPSHARDFTFSRHIAPELCCPSPPSKVPRAQGRPGAGWHPRSAVREMRWKQMHSGIQVKPNIRPSLRSGFTAYVVISPGSDALLPPSPCGWLTRPPGWAAHVTARLGTQTPDARTTRFCRTQAAPVVCAQAGAHGGSRPANHRRADAACVHHVPTRVS
ncbi:hypothetical protein SAMN04487925_101360 [Bradyrhizobium sp. cf659]|nr:hypothetical protein SAMN04487925_101360 [Bradyrhizobium sp. cf659]